MCLPMTLYHEQCWNGFANWIDSTAVKRQFFNLAGYLLNTFSELW